MVPSKAMNFELKYFMIIIVIDTKQLPTGHLNKETFGQRQK